MTGVDLGFAEESPPWRITSRHFPSKIGGKPAWLDLENVPRGEKLQCETCKKQMLFLCQIYAPYEDDPDNFHRTVFIFVCKNPICCRKNIGTNLKVFRSSLPRKNRFYSYDPPQDVPDEDVHFTLTKWLRLCQFCGCPGEKHCAKCKAAVYCCRDHQVSDWNIHKEHCGRNTLQPSSPKLFREYEITMETEEITDNHTSEEDEMNKFKELENLGKTGTMSEADESQLEAHALVDADKTFSKFRKRIEPSSDQVIRYSRGGDVLWIAANPKPEVIPNCEHCGQSRQFEFQVMPQMLAVLHEIELDWGILAVYTCTTSCVSGPNYKSEFIYKQDIVSESN